MHIHELRQTRKFQIEILLGCSAKNSGNVTAEFCRNLAEPRWFFLIFGVRLLYVFPTLRPRAGPNEETRTSDHMRECGFQTTHGAAAFGFEVTFGKAAPQLVAKSELRSKPRGGHERQAAPCQSRPFRPAELLPAFAGVVLRRRRLSE